MIIFLLIPLIIIKKNNIMCNPFTDHLRSINVKKKMIEYDLPNSVITIIFIGF